MLRSDLQTVKMCGILMGIFIASCIIDVTGVYPMMNNVAILLVLIGLFIFLLFSIFYSNSTGNFVKEKPKEEEDDIDVPFREL